MKSLRRKAKGNQNQNRGQKKEGCPGIKWGNRIEDKRREGRMRGRKNQTDMK
jgi:hypothetical protein